jgi:MoxR-like ATPase
MGSTRVAQGRNVLPDPFINRFKYIWVNDKTRSEEREIVEELLKKRGLDVSLAGAIASFHESFEKAAALGKIGAESSEGYRTSLRELVRVVNFLSEHRRTLSGREALLWAVREVYVNRLRQADKAHVMASCIEPVLKPNAEDMRTVFGDLNGGCEYEIVRDGARGVIIARANGRTIVEQPVLGVVDEAAVSAQNIVLDNDTKRELADLMLASSQSTLAPVFLMGPTATGKTTKIRYLSALVGKQFTRVQFNAQTDELDLIGHFMPKGVSIKLDDAVRVIQEYLAEGSVFKVQYALSVLLPDDAQKRRALTDAVFARETAAGILSLREGRGEFIRAIAHILINGTTGIEMEFRPGHFLQALTRGDWILLDELNLAREENLGILYGLLTRGYIDIGGTRYDVKKNGGMIFAAGNYSTDVGRQLFSEALENRFQIISYPPLSAKRLGRILYEKYPIAGIGEDDVTRLVGLTRELDDLSKAEVFKGFDGEGAMPFTIRNMENILINAGIRTSWRKDAGSREALIKEIYSEYRDILCRDDANLELLRQAVKKHFGGDTAIPPADLKISDDGIELDGLYFPGPRDTANIDRSRVPTAEDVELVGTPTMLDTMRSALYGFRNPRRPVLLVGPPGAGKTDTIQNLCRLLGWQYHSENLRDTPLSSLLGTWRRDPVTAVLSYKDGILIEAMKKGYCLVFEEINFMETGLLEVISEWIDEGYFINPKTHEKIAVHPDFRFFATMNPIKGANRFSKGRNKLPSPFLNRFKIAWIAEPAYDELVAIMGEIFAKYGLNTGCIKDLVRMHCDFNRWVDQEVFGQETPEGYKVTIRELMRVARFIKKHAPVMGEKEALGWAIKEVYFKRLGKEEEKTLLVNRIISSPALQNIDFTTVFSKEADYSDSHTDAAFAEAALKDLAADSESLCIKVFMNNLSYYIKRGHMEEAFLLLKLLPPPISIKTLRMVTKITPNYIVAIAHAVAKGGPEPARRELLRKVNDILLREKSATHKVLYPLAEAFGVLAASIDQETTLEAYRQFMDMIKEGWGNGPASHGMGFLGPGLSQKEKGWAIDALLNKYLFHNAWSHGPDVARISARIRSVAMIAGTFTDEKDRRRAAEKLLSFRDSHGVGYANDSFSWALRDIAAGISSDELKYNMVEDLLKYAIEEAWPDKKIRSLDTLQAIAVMIKNENLRLKIAEALEGVILRDRPHMLGELVNAYGGVAGSLSYKGARKRSLAIIQSGVSRTEDASKGAALKGLARFLATSDDERAKESMIKAFFSQIGKGLDADSEMKAFESAGILICSLADKDAQQDRINALLDLYDNKTVLPTTAGAFIAALDQFKDKVKDKMQRARILNKVFEIITGVCAHFEMFKSEEFQARISRIIEAMIRDDMRAIERKVIEKEGRAGGKLSRKIKVSELKEGKYAIDIDEASGVLIGKYGGKDLVRQKIFGKIDRERLAAAKLKLNDRVMKDLIDMVFFTSMDELVPVFLLGPTGIGKTAKIRYLSALVGKDFRRVQFNAQTDEFDLIGHFMPKGVSIGYPEASYVVQEHMAKGSWAQLQQALGLVLPTEKMRQKAGTDLEFARRHIEAALYLGKTDGELVRGIAHILLHGASGVELEFRKAEFLLSLERGDWILLDEINLAREESLGVLYGLLTRGYLEYDGKRIDVKSRGGMIFAAGNLSYDLGRQLFSEAFENRFQIFNMSRMGRRDEALILYDLFPIKGISFDDIESLVELNYAMAKLLEAKRFAGFENERPYPFTIRNMIAILSNTAMRLAEPGNTLSSKEAFLKEIFIEYRDILHRDPSNVKLLKNHIALSFQGGAKIPDISFKFTDNDDKIDGISLASPASPGTVDREKIPDIRTADLVYTEGTVDIMRAANYGFKNPRRPVMLIGQPGGGKTDTIAQLARLRGWQYHSENMRDTTLSTLIGTWARDPKSGMLHFKDGVLIEAMKNGTCLVLEEINFMDSGLLEVISEWVDEGYFTNPKTHERIAVHPDFRLFATMNPVQGKTRVALGRNYLPAPFVNRFKLVWVHEKGPQEQFHIIERLLTKAAVATEGRSETFARTEDAIGEAAKAMRERAGTIREQLVSRMIAPESGEEDGEDGEKAPGAKRLLFVEGEQDAGPNAPGGTAAMIENDEGDLDDGKRRRGVEMDVHPDDIVNAKLHQEVQKDPRLLSAIEARAREFHSFFERACKGLVKIRHGRSWAYFSDTETLTYPLDRLLDTPQDKLGAIGFHEGLHRLLTRYNVAKGPDLMPFMDKYTNMLFNAAEDVAIERFGRHLAKGSGEMLDGLYDKLDDKDWLKSHFGDKVPDHVKFAFGALYYGQRGRIPDQLGGKVGEVLRRPDIQKEFDEYFESIPKMKTETGEEIVNTDPTPMEVSAAAAKRLDTLQRKVMKEYKTFLRDDLVKMREDMGRGGLRRTIRVMLGGGGGGSGSGRRVPVASGMPDGGQPGSGTSPGGDPIDGDPMDLRYDDLPEDMKRELDNAVAKYIEELKDRTRAGAPDWEKACKQERDRNIERERVKEFVGDLKEKRGANEGTATETDDSLLRQLERMKDYSNEMTKGMSLYQYNLFTISRLVNILTGQLSNIIRNDTQPRWITNQPHGRDIDWDRFFQSVMSGYSDEKYWRERIIPKKRSIKFTLLIDESGSMSGPRGENALHAAIIFMDVLHNLGIDFSVMGFGSKNYYHKTFRNHQLPKVVNSYDSTKDRNAIMEELASTMSCGGSTADGEALNRALNDIEKYGGDKNVAIVLTDGEGNTGVELANVMKRAESMNVKVIGVGIDQSISYVAHNYKNNVQIPDIETLPQEFRNILRREIAQWFSSDMSRGGVSEELETHPALNSAAQEGRMFALTLAEASVLGDDAPAEELASRIIANVRDIADRDRAKEAIVSRLRSDTYRKDLIAAFRRAAADVPEASRRPGLRICFLQEPEGSPAPVYNDMCHNLVAHAGKGVKTGQNIPSLYFGFNAYRTAAGQGNVKAFTEIVQHECRDLERGYHVDDMPAGAGELYDDTIDLYDVGSVISLALDHIGHGLKPGGEFTIRYDTSRLRRDEIAIVKTYAGTLAKRSGCDVKCVPVSPVRSAGAAPLISVKCVHEGGAGEGSVDVIGMDSGSHILRLTGLLNLAVASSCIPDGAQDTAEYSHIIGFMKRQFRIIMGADTSLPSDGNALVSFMKRLIITLPPAWRMPEDAIRDYYNRSLEALTAA